MVQAKGRVLAPIPPLLLLLLLFFSHPLLPITDALAVHNDRPIIGVLSQSPPSSLIGNLSDHNYTSYVAASYVKHMEGAGARVVPILDYPDDAYYHHLAHSLNGLVFPGGGSSIDNTSSYGRAGQRLYNLVVSINEAGTHLPLWGTCLGFQMLTYLGAGDNHWLTSCQAEGRADSLTFQPGYEESRLYQQMPADVFHALATENVTANFHYYCITPENFNKSGLWRDFRVVATSKDAAGVQYVALMEHRRLPIYGSQFHPERNLYEWHWSSTPHSAHAALVSQYFASFFVNQARLNSQKFPTQQEEARALIYQYQPLYTYNISSYVLSYLFRPPKFPSEVEEIPAKKEDASNTGVAQNELRTSNAGEDEENMNQVGVAELAWNKAEDKVTQIGGRNFQMSTGDDKINLVPLGDSEKWRNMAEDVLEVTQVKLMKLQEEQRRKEAKYNAFIYNLLRKLQQK